MSERCDCGALTYYGEKEKDGGLCESCYVGELEAMADDYASLRTRVAELEEQQKWCYSSAEVHVFVDRYRKALEDKLEKLADMNPVSDQQAVYDSWAKWIYDTLKVKGGEDE